MFTSIEIVFYLEIARFLCVRMRIVEVCLIYISSPESIKFYVFLFLYFSLVFCLSFDFDSLFFFSLCDNSISPLDIVSYIYSLKRQNSSNNSSRETIMIMKINECICNSYTCVFCLLIFLLNFLLFFLHQFLFRSMIIMLGVQVNIHI